MTDFVETLMTAQAHAMCEAVMAAPQYSRLGQITGDPGTGKSATTQWLCTRFNAVRIEAWAGMKSKTVLQELAHALQNKGVKVDANGTANTITQRIVRAGIGQMLIIVDEANHLRWSELELLRSISDISGAGLVIVGTDLLAKKFTHPQIYTFLEQFRQRIGAKKVLLEPMADHREMAAYVLNSRFGQVTEETARRFHKRSKGHWRIALEIAETCERLMLNERMERLEPHVVDTAGAWMAGYA